MFVYKRQSGQCYSRSPAFSSDSFGLENDMTRPIKFGICGLGRIGRKRCRVFANESEKYELTALCDIHQKVVQGMTETLGGVGYSDIARFLENPEMELAMISTPSIDHVRHAQQALAAGKIVLLEKPIGVTSQDYRSLQQLCQKYPGKLYFCHNHRFEPAFMNAQEIVASGLLGNIQVAKLCKHHRFMRRNDWQMRLDCGGGQLSVWGPHLIDQGLQLLGAPVRDIHSYLRRVLTPGDGDDHVKIALLGENNVVVEVEISNSVALPGPYCTIYGDRGALVYGQQQKNIQLKYLDPDFHWPQATASAERPQGTMWADEEQLPWIEETRPVVPDTDMYKQVEIEIAKHLYSAIRDNIPFPIKDADALEVVRVTECVKKQNSQFNWL